MDDDTQSAAEHQQQLDERRRFEDGWQWWPAYHKALCEQQRAEREALDVKIREWLR